MNKCEFSPNQKIRRVCSAWRPPACQEDAEHCYLRNAKLRLEQIELEERVRKEAERSRRIKGLSLLW